MYSLTCYNFDHRKIMSEEVVRAMIRVIGEMILLKHKKCRVKKKKEWVRK